MSTDKIEQLGRVCRALSNRGRRMHIHEAHLFLFALDKGNLSKCVELIQTIRRRA